MADPTPAGTRRRSEAEREALIAGALVRITTLGMSDREIERAAGVPGAFLAKARAGRNRGERAWEPGGSWEKLLAWLARQGGPVASPSSTSAPSSIPSSPGSASAELRAAIEAAQSASDYTACARRVAADVVAGRMDRGDADSVLGALREARASRKVEREETAREKVRALEILTPDEVELLAAFREVLAGAPLQPGEGAPNPTDVLPGPSSSGLVAAARAAWGLEKPQGTVVGPGRQTARKDG